MVASRGVLACLVGAVCVFTAPLTAMGEVGVVGVGAAFAAEPQRWSGVVDLPGGMKLEFDVTLEEGKGTISIPMQNAKDLELTDVKVTKELLAFTLSGPGATDATKARFEVKPDADGKTAAGVLKQVGQEFKVTMKRLGEGEVVKGSARPQEPKPPFPYTSMDVTFKVERGGNIGHTLAGTLTIPEGPGPHPAVVLVSGSGPQDRDESLMGHKPFLVLADHLTRRGVAVLRYDDRGVGKSTGDFRVATTDDFVDDAVAAGAFLKTRPEILGAKIGVVGHSEGGMVGPMAAARPDAGGFAFVVMMAGPGQGSVDLLTLQGKLIAIASGTSAADADRISQGSRSVLAMVRDQKPDEEIQAKILELVTAEMRLAPETGALSEDKLMEEAKRTAAQQWTALSSPWMKRFLAIDPASYLGKVKIPVLAINGEKDLQVPPKENLALVKTLIEEGGNKAVTTKELPGLNHLFQNCTTGGPGEYAVIEETMAPAALDLITSWIRERTGVEQKPAPKAP